MKLDDERYVDVEKMLQCRHDNPKRRRGVKRETPAMRKAAQKRKATIAAKAVAAAEPAAAAAAAPPKKRAKTAAAAAGAFEYAEHDVVWVKLGSFPWWPARVAASDDGKKDGGMIYKGKSKVHVRFFGDDSTAWADLKKVKGFEQHVAAHGKGKKVAEAVAEARQWLTDNAPPASDDTEMKEADDDSPPAAAVDSGSVGVSGSAPGSGVVGSGAAAGPVITLSSLPPRVRNGLVDASTRCKFSCALCLCL